MSRHRLITLGLVLSSASSATGLIAFCVVALIATDLALLPEFVRWGLVAIGGVFVAIGAEGGSLFTTVEAFRKTGRLQGWDIVGQVISQCATLSTVTFAFATLSGAAASWSQFVATWGYVANVLFVALDAAFNYVALGLHLRQLERDRIAQLQEHFDYERARLDIERQRFALEAQQAQYRETDTAPMETVVAQNESTPDIKQVGLSKRGKVLAILNNNGTHSTQEIARLSGCSVQYVRQVRKEFLV
jgi:nitrogen fixation protein FixH